MVARPMGCKGNSMNDERFLKQYLREERGQVEDFNRQTKKASKEHNAIESPSHYMFFDMEAIDIIKASLTKEEFKGYLKGNSLKYRLRCGKKDDAIQDLGKANQYEKMWEEIK